MDLSPGQREEIRRRLETCLDALVRAGTTERDERIEALSTRVRQAEEHLARAQ
jgi:hypothetical protein